MNSWCDYVDVVEKEKKINQLPAQMKYLYLLWETKNI